MNKLKTVSDFFKRYLFWFISSSTVVLVLMCWWWATGTLAGDFNKQVTEIQGKFSAVEAIAGNSEHPTPEYIKAVNDKNEKLKEGVLTVWKTLYKEQTEKNRWPDVLGRDFIEQINKLSADASIPGPLLERYQNIIKQYFPKLFDIINVRHPADTPLDAKPADAAGDRGRPIRGFLQRLGQGVGGRGAAENADMVGVVDWDESDLDSLKRRFDWSKTPDSIEVRMAQEDLWVYKTLLQVISQTNGAATDQSQAKVKRIEWIAIGGDAVKAWTEAEQSVFRMQAPSSEGGARVETRTAPTGREAATQDNKELLMKDRYVDDKGVPLAADAKHPYAEFKMMPISMKLHMDQRKISELLVECVNRPMPIEVRRVRIRPGEGELLDAAALVPATAPGAGRTDTMRRGPEGRGAPGRYNRPGVDTTEAEAGPYDIPVEIQGIIYIYNPPDLNTLGTGTAGEKPAEGAPGAAPAAEGAAAAPATPPNP